MYSVSNDFLTAIKANTRQITWSGTITTTGGSTYSLTMDNFPAGGSITRSISSQSLKVGTVNAAQIQIEIILSGVSRYELYGGTISLYCAISGASDSVPMGTFIIAEVTQASDHITISGYDNMVLFDEYEFSADTQLTLQTPYYWLAAACSACGVTLGSTLAEIQALPNGNRQTGYASAVTDVETWRDALSYLVAYLGGYAYIGRDGYLYVENYASSSDDTVPASFRYSSDLSDYQTTYNGLYATYKEEGTQEYVSNTNADGLVLDLGVNPFLQITNSTNRAAAIQAIIDAWDGVSYVPFNCEMPLVPIYDPGDVLTFTDNQAGAYDFGAITEITYKIGGSMSVKCTGENPILAAAQDRITKSVSGLSSDYNSGQSSGGKDVWFLTVTNSSALTVSSTEVQIAEIDYTQTTYGQDLELIVTIDAVLSATAVVELRVVVDDDSSMEMSVTESKSLLGERVFHCTSGQTVYTTGTHTCKVYMTVTDSALLVGDLV